MRMTLRGLGVGGKLSSPLPICGLTVAYLLSPSRVRVSPLAAWERFADRSQCKNRFDRVEYFHPRFSDGS